MPSGAVCNTSSKTRMVAGRIAIAQHQPRAALRVEPMVEPRGDLKVKVEQIIIERWTKATTPPAAEFKTMQTSCQR